MSHIGTSNHEGCNAASNSRELTAPGPSDHALRELLAPGYSADIGISKHGGRARRLNGAILALTAILLLGLLWWFDPAETNMPLCSFHALTGFDCPGCGATRATHKLLHGRLLAALHYNALWVLSLPLATYLAVSELRVRYGRKPLPGDLARQTWFWLSMAVVAVGFFVVRNLP